MSDLEELISWKSPTLYKRTPTGTIRTWRVETDFNQWFTVTGVYGQDNDKASARKVVTQKNVGQANYRTGPQAAVDKAKSQYRTKLKEDYVESIEELEEQDKIPRAMLAVPKLEKQIHYVRAAISNGRCWIQPKLDGFRCLATKDGLYTRQLRQFHTCPHIEEALQPFFKKHPDAVIDGELYSHNMPFNKIQSLLTRENADMLEQLEVREHISYNVYDFVDDATFYVRFKKYAMDLKFVDFVNLVSTDRVSHEDDIYETQTRFVAEGYEGSMVRISKYGYEQNKRSNQLIKVKDFDDEEFEIVAVTEGQGQWAGAAKSMVCRDANGVTFDTGCTGTMAQLTRIYEEQEAYIGGKVTVKFHGKFPSGRPRFPVATKYYTR